MRRQAYLASLIAAGFTLAYSAIAWCLSPVLSFIERVTWPPYDNVQLELAYLGIISPPREIPERWRQFRAFVERARSHSHYFAGGFY